MRHAGTCWLKVSLSLKLRCRAPQQPPVALSGQNISQGRKLVKKVKIWKVLRMEFSIVGNLSGLQESIFNLSRGPQLHFGKKSKNWSNFIKFQRLTARAAHPGVAKNVWNRPGGKCCIRGMGRAPGCAPLRGT